VLRNFYGHDQYKTLSKLLYCADSFLLPKKSIEVTKLIPDSTLKVKAISGQNEKAGASAPDTIHFVESS
jgi:hypothetical protein